jgi:hypothetical protein
MWLKSRSIEKEAAPTKLGGSLTGCEGSRSISTTILPPIADATAKEAIAHAKVWKEEENAETGSWTAAGLPAAIRASVTPGFV